MFRKILIADDGSEGAARALSVAIIEAKAHNAQLQRRLVLAALGRLALRRAATGE